MGVVSVDEGKAKQLNNMPVMKRERERERDQGGAERKFHRAIRNNKALSAGRKS